MKWFHCSFIFIHNYILSIKKNTFFYFGQLQFEWFLMFLNTYYDDFIWNFRFIDGILKLWVS